MLNMSYEESINRQQFAKENQCNQFRRQNSEIRTRLNDN